MLIPRRLAIFANRLQTAATQDVTEGNLHFVQISFEGAYKVRIL